ncbi:hypothetical protein [Azospirillum sp. SYSU D00513]|uniref:hypothetical protein n=1 Tax=Azospirillum sp. SYSU D00513 TaxID=2812561 RepID=UPI001A964F65|nr:hypothetical protein [Azospirillum sp. SYSU D00513]
MADDDRHGLHVPLRTSVRDDLTGTGGEVSQFAASLFSNIESGSAQAGLSWKLNRIEFPGGCLG